MSVAARVAAASAVRSRPAHAGRRGPLDLSLYLVTDTRLCEGAGVPATVAAAVGAGVTVVQLRDHDACDDNFVALGRQLRAALDGTGVPLLVDDRVDLVEVIGADGAHIGQSDLDVPRARALLGEDRYLGLSVHDVAHVAAARGHGIDAVDYLGVGPVWPTATKPDHVPAGGIDAVRRVAAASPWPCVAIGGITADRVELLRGTGVAGIAVVSAICGRQDVRAAARELRRAWGAG
ncbi:MAG: thiamine-phosphate synthase [Actinotalea sp.]|nr:thiamine-phosphate synthase [Actinotalea sp.]